MNAVTLNPGAYPQVFSQDMEIGDDEVTGFKPNEMFSAETVAINCVNPFVSPHLRGATHKESTHNAHSE